MEHYFTGVSSCFVAEINGLKQQFDLSKRSFNIVQILASYLNLRGFKPGPLFIYNGKPVSRRFFNSILHSSLESANIRSDNIKSHSFRIGAVTMCIQKGYSYEQIQLMGRWKSEAVKRYARIQSFHN